jgi:hypothetical protein
MKKGNFREKRKAEETLLAGRCILTRQILKVCQKGTNLRLNFGQSIFASGKGRVPRYAKKVRN